MKNKNKIDKSIIGIFLTMLILPSIIYFFVEDKLPEDNNENRKLAEKPVFKMETLSEFPEKYDEYYNDNLPFRNFIQKQYNNLSYYVFGIKSLNKVLVGKQTENGNMQWLFFNSKDDGDPIQYVIGNKEFTDDEKNVFMINVKQNTAQMKSRNVEMYYFIAPNKSTIYKELLPDNIKIKNDKNCVQELVDYTKTQNIDNIVYPYTELMEAKSMGYVFYSLDSHWNAYGGFIGTQVLNNRINPNYKELFDNVTVKFGDFKKDTGDLAQMLNISSMGRFREQKIKIENFLDEEKYTTKEFSEIYTYINENPVINKKIMLIGDSFGKLLSENFAKMYSEITYLPFLKYNKTLLDTLDPDIIIIETVERFIDRMINFSF